MKALSICILSLLLMACFPVKSGAEESPADKPHLIATLDVNSQAVERDSARLGQPPGLPEVLSLSIQDLIQLVRDKNERIRYKQLEWEISSEGIKNARSIFEPEFVSSYQHEKSRRQNTAEEERSQFQSLFDERNNNYNAAIEGLVPTGGKMRLGYTLRHLSNNLTGLFSITPQEDQYVTFLGGSITQPLLKSGGVTATMANIRLAEADLDIAFQAYRQEIMREVSNAASAYWDLYLAQEKYRVRRDSVRIAEQILKDNRERVKTGKMAETEVLEAEAGLALRNSLEIAAKQDLIFAINNVRTLFSSSAAESELRIRATDRIEIDEIKTQAIAPYMGASLQKAFELRPEYISSRQKIEREGIRIAFAENQRWPQLDLNASYGLNGLDYSAGSSFSEAINQNYKAWSVGLELRIPLGGGKKSRSELEAARHRKRQALLEVKAVEVALANAVDTAIRNLRSTREQVMCYANVVDSNKRLLEVELARFEAGKSNSRLVLDREEDLNKAREFELESLVNYKKALLQLKIAEGSLLINYGIEVMEVKSDSQSGRS